MSLSVDGVWKAGVWATTVWADGVWREGAAPVVSVQRGGTSKRDKRLKRKRPRYYWEEEPKQETAIQAPPEAVPEPERPGADYSAFDAVAADIEQRARAQFEELQRRKRRRKRMLAALLAVLEDDE